MTPPIDPLKAARAPERPRLLLEELEPRILFSADVPALLGLGSIADATQVREFESAAPQGMASGTTVATHATVAAHTAAEREMVFIDSRVADPMGLADELQKQRGNGRVFDIVVLEAEANGIEQISDVLAGEEGLAAIHVISHGHAGVIQLGSAHLDSAQLTRDADSIGLWGRSLSVDGDLLLYGCNVAQGESGRQFVNSLARLTLADVAASTGLTGSAWRGGDWVLEYRAGSVEADAMFHQAALQWDGTLAAVSVTTTTDNNDSGIVGGNASHTIAWLNANVGADGQVSLREAIIAANNTTGADSIGFSIAGSGVHTIALTAALPDITGEVFLDGYSQPGASQNTLDTGNDAVLMIELSGTAAGAGVDGLRLAAGSAGTTIRGLVINGFGGDGIEINGSAGNTIAGNFIGTSASGTSAAANTGNAIKVANSAGNMIGGSAAALRNLLSGNSGNGVSISGAGSTNNTVQGNYIGTNAAGSAALPNANDGIGIDSGASGNVVGGTTSGERNVISGNAREGIEFNGTTTAGNVVQGNYIGLNANGSAAMGNAGVGIYLWSSSNNTIGGTEAGAGNTIVGNTYGIVSQEASATGISILGNSIHGNTFMGIDLNWDAVTANDANDADTGTNGLQNYPVITSAATNGAGSLRLIGTFNSNAGASYRIEFFGSAAEDGTGYGEGQTYLGSTSVTTDGSGNASFDVLLSATVAIGHAISALATVDLGGGNYGSTSEFARNALAANTNTAPVITSDGGGASASVSVAENTTAVTTVVATDADPSSTVSYSISGGADAARFTIDSATGVLAFVSAPDFEAPTDANVDNIYEVTVRAGDGTYTDTQALSITVTAANDPPAITSNGGGVAGAVAVGENTTAVTTVTAIDTDLPGQSVTYGISGGADAARFTINSSTGALAFVSTPDFESPADSNADNAYEVTLQASDGTLTDTQALTVLVTPANDNAPTIISNGSGADATATILENRTAVTTIVATDADRPTQRLTYGISGGADAARFTINSSTGALAFASAPDFERPSDSNADNVYEVAVQASDGTFHDTQTFTITVTAANDHAPVITNNGGGVAAVITVVENAMVVTAVAATDADLPAQRLTYGISGGADAARFTINSSTGELAFTSAPDAERPTDSDADNVYAVSVEASDGTLRDTQSLTITVTAANDNAPNITSNGGGDAAVVAIEENTTIVTTIIAADVDRPAQQLTYSISGGADASRFTIDSSTGALAFVSAPDFESPADSNADNNYELRIQASDGTLTDTQALTVTVTAGNDNAPAIISNGGGAGAGVSIDENTTAVTTVVATDADRPAQSLTHSISGGADATRFTIDRSTGALAFLTAPNFEAPTDSNADSVYELIVQVSDGNLVSSQAIAVAVLNVYEGLLALDHELGVVEGTARQIDLTAGARNADAAPNGALQDARAVIVDAPTRGSLVLHAGGTVTYTHDGSETVSDSFSYILRDGAASSSVATVKLAVTPFNDAPAVTAAALSLRAGEGGLVLGPANLSASDPDNAAAALSFVVSDLRHGRFEWVTAPGTPISHFTQADVGEGRVRFVHTSAVDDPAFRVSAFDGETYSESVNAVIVVERPFVVPGGGAFAPPGMSPANESPQLTPESGSPAPSVSPVAELADRALGPPGAGHAIDHPADPALSRLEPVASRPLSHESPARIPRPHADLDRVLPARLATDQYLIQAIQPSIDDASAAGTVLHTGPGSNLIVNATTDGENAGTADVSLTKLAQVTAIALAAGTVWWGMRSGGLLTGLLVLLPVWRHADLLAVLPDDDEGDGWDQYDDEEAERDERAVEDVLQPAIDGGLK